MKKTKKIKSVELPVEFNPGLKKYEPVLPVRKTRKKFKAEFDWKWIIIILISIVILTIFGIILSKFIK